jgi:hypothetical protein
VYTYLQAGPALPEDQRPVPDVAVYDQLLTAASVAPAPSLVESRDAAQVPDEPAPASATRAERRGSRRLADKPRSPRVRPDTSAGVPVRELVNVHRDPAGGYRVSDHDAYLGKVERQVKITGGRGRWQVRDETNHVITHRGPWNTVDEAVVGLLLEHLDRSDRRPRRS